ncbi:MAG TPA: winged helix DNA-binding domain-containing protein [Acidimicrobiia bacterium]|nr:winged helix DNA-binding domain-containing protein [Acidimicrobiia bacterium]
MPHISRDQRRARLARRHLLATSGSNPTEVARALVALHSSDPVTVYLSVWARVAGFEVPDLESALYVGRSLVRHIGMRRTLWVVDREMLPILVASSTGVIAERERRRSIEIIEKGEISDDGAAWLDSMMRRTLAAVRDNGELFARDLSRQFPELAQKIVFRNKAGKVQGTTGMSSRTLLQLAMESKVVRARPAGSWVSGQYSYAETERWLGGPIEEVPIDVACAVLVRSWLHSFGPATEADVVWWTGWPVRRVREALADVGAVAVSLDDDKLGYLLPDDLDPVAPPGPWIAFLPSLDPTIMGWKERDWYLGEHYSKLFDRNGNAGPTVWADGRVVGGWAQRRDGRVVYELLEEVGAEARSAIAYRGDELERWLGDVRVTPRFRSPHDKALAPRE